MYQAKKKATQKKRTSKIFKIRTAEKKARKDVGVEGESCFCDNLDSWGLTPDIGEQLQQWVPASSSVIWVQKSAVLGTAKTLKGPQAKFGFYVDSHGLSKQMPTSIKIIHFKSTAVLSLHLVQMKTQTQFQHVPFIHKSVKAAVIIK